MLETHEDGNGRSSRFMDAAEGARVIWDFDGVVGHTEPLHEASYRELATRRSYEFDADFFAELVGHTEQWIWERVIDHGFPASKDEIPALHRERGDIVAQAALQNLLPSWLAADLMPRLAPLASQQIVVSNGDPDLIQALLATWTLDSYVDVARRSPGQDKEKIFRAYCVPPCLVLEDSDFYLTLGKELGAFTVGVRHSHNPRATLQADLTAHL
jgi:beta-phosphoglucomutase-like phosphatase (HAD superfamily)